IGSMSGAQSVNRSLVIQVNNSVPAGVTTVVNTAHVADDGTHGADLNPGNNTTSDSDTLNAAPDLTITKDHGLTTLLPGKKGTSAWAFSNGGNQAATGVVATDPLPANTTFVSASNGGPLANGVVTWTIGPLATGGNVLRTIPVQVSNLAPAGAATIVNSA